MLPCHLFRRAVCVLRTSAGACSVSPSERNVCAVASRAELLRTVAAAVVAAAATAVPTLAAIAALRESTADTTASTTARRGV